MIPVIIFEPEEHQRSQILHFLKRFSEASGQRFRILGNAATKEDAASCLDAGQGVFLLILGTQSGGGADAVSLERRAGTISRDSYTLYWLHDLADLPEVASLCLRPSGFILPPPDPERFDAAMRRICEDYSAMRDGGEEQFLAFQVGGTLHRLQISSIDYLEALDKKLNIWTRRQCLTVYEKLGHMEELLGDRFFRCHRSYLVNYDRIEMVDFAAMELQLAGQRLPLSRSAKDALRARIQREGEKA